ncbi:MAG TPA: GFA family protein [Rhizomicrobium sp.]
MNVEGQCHCGRIAYEAVVNENVAGICHCTDCQTFSGSPFRASVPAEAGDFHLLRGEPKTYVKTADSGNKRAQAFCGDCGTPICVGAGKPHAIQSASRRRQATGANQTKAANLVQLGAGVGARHLSNSRNPERVTAALAALQPIRILHGQHILRFR